MKPVNSDHPNRGEPADIFHAVESLNSQLRVIEKFVARRFDEISMEINATAQQVDMAEDGIVRRFQEILEVLSAISYKGDGKSAANSGVELEAIIEDTEDAANRILDAADRIVEYVSNDHEKDWDNPKTRDDLRERIRNDIQEILLACTFQDLTGQRIRNTLNNLHDIENRISSAFERLGIQVRPEQAVIEERVGKASNQDEIDALLREMNGGSKS
ncbi:MAG: hypothetical protein KA099_03180 [Alphaproteobacteria bacterium]|nr:hypothetical protein [Alphaproteobacteria bacterium]MBP7759346.1 hypothetical protein [Alphaproteobacteria bacterium]MBP7762559.1 hypothetical protein [Alphaproteobacteria bacterium]MBP7904306.1 hypothetical protein [Alphaproteobacteria bacterium]